MNLKQYLKQYLELKNINTNKTFSCLVHSDKNPSMKMYRDKVVCFSCNFKGDIVDLVKAEHLCNFKTAKSIICEMFGISETSHKISKNDIKVEENQNIFMSNFIEDVLFELQVLYDTLDNNELYNMICKLLEGSLQQKYNYAVYVKFHKLKKEIDKMNKIQELHTLLARFDKACMYFQENPNLEIEDNAFYKKCIVALETIKSDSDKLCVAIKKEYGEEFLYELVSTKNINKFIQKHKIYER